MLVRYTQISQASGSAGGLTAAKNRGGNYLRKRIKPLNPRSTNQDRARANLAAAAAQWRELDPEDQATWFAYADGTPVSNKLGEQIKLSGIDWFTRINSLRGLAGQALLSAAPAGFGQPIFSPPTGVEVDHGTGQITGTLEPTDSWAATTNGRLFVFITPGQSPGRYSPVNAFRFVGTVAGNTGSPPAVLGMTVSNGIALVAGQVYFVRFRSQDSTGRVSLDNIQRVVAA